MERRHFLLGLLAGAALATVPAKAAAGAEEAPAPDLLDGAATDPVYMQFRRSRRRVRRRRRRGRRRGRARAAPPIRHAAPQAPRRQLRFD